MITKLREWWPDEDIRALKYVPSTNRYEVFEIWLSPQPAVAEHPVTEAIWLKA